MQINEKIYVGYDNAIKLKLFEDETPYTEAYPSNAPTRFILTIGDIVVDSSNDPNVFTWDSDASTVSIKLGRYTDTSGLNYLYKAWAKLVIYSALWPNGVVWVHPTETPDKLQIEVVTR